MAKKTENNEKQSSKKEKGLQYLQMPLPQGGKFSKMTKLVFGGVNKRYTIDSGEMSAESNISSSEYPYIVPASMIEIDTRQDAYVNYTAPDNYEDKNPGIAPLGMYAFEDFMVIVYGVAEIVKEESGLTKYLYHDIQIAYIDSKGEIHTGIIKSDTLLASDVSEDDIVPASVIQFNVYDTPTDPLNGNYVKKLLIFPHKASMFMHIVKAETNPEDWMDEWEGASDKEKPNTALANADLGVMYWCKGNDDIKRYYTVKLVPKKDGDDGYDENRVTYKRAIVKMHETTRINSANNTETTYTVNDAFFCDSMEAVVKTYKNSTPDVDASGAIIYPPPETANKNYYYMNTADIEGTNFGTDVYKWSEYETVKREDEWGLKRDKNGNLPTNEDGNYTLELEGFILDESKNFIPDGGTEKGWKVAVPPTVPTLNHVTVHLSRVFGVDDDRVYASGFNDYSNWNLDTAGEYNESNSWCSPSQSNAKAGGKFTGITTYQGHVICFKKDFMHEIYNTCNPFRLQDVFAEGTIDNRTIQDVDGKLIFVSEDDVKIYTGSNPRVIGYNLNMPQYTYAVSGTDNQNYYLYCEDNAGNGYLYVYDTYVEVWTELAIDQRVLNFAHNKNGMYMLCENGYVYQLDTGDYSNQEWFFETDLITNKTADIKHIKKLQMLVDMPEYLGEAENKAEMKVYILYDDEVFDELGEDAKKRLVYDTTTNKRYGKYPIRVKPRKTANFGFRLRFEGVGYVKLHELEIFIEPGGDMYV